MQMPSINIFMISPGTDKKKDKKSVLSEALRSRKRDEQHEQTMGKLSEMIREIGVLPHAEHAGGG